MGLEFKKNETLGGGWSLEVRRAGFLVGHIRKRPDTSAYCYFRGSDNILSPSYENADLEVLKRQVSSNP